MDAHHQETQREASQMTADSLGSKDQMQQSRARSNGRSMNNVRTDCGFDRSNFCLAGHVDRSKFNRIENEINLRFPAVQVLFIESCIADLLYEILVTCN